MTKNSHSAVFCSTNNNIMSWMQKKNATFLILKMYISFSIQTNRNKSKLECAYFHAKSTIRLKSSRICDASMNMRFTTEIKTLITTCEFADIDSMLIFTNLQQIQHSFCRSFIWTTNKNLDGMLLT